MWVAILCALLCLGVLWALWERRALARCPVGVVVPGAHAAMVSGDELPSASLGVAVLEAIGRGEPRAIAAAEPNPSRTAAISGEAGMSLAGTVALPAGLALGTGLADWMTVDENVLDALGQWTHTDLQNGFDLWSTLQVKDYQLATPGFEVKLRGHVGEQEVQEQLTAWAGSDLSMPDASNNPAFDLTLGGHEFNVKVGADSSTIAEHLRDHPGIPVIVNADMEGLPADAFHVDLSAPLDPDLLAGHSVIVADGLFLSDLQDQMADAFGPVLSSFDAGDLLDGAADLGIPVLGSAVRVVRSGVREHRLVAHHGDKQRAAANIASDVAIVGGGVAGGGLLGTFLGAGIDLATGGATMGLGTTVIGPFIGSALGGLFGGKAATHKRMAPLRDARTAAGEATLEYDKVVADGISLGNRTWTETAIPDAEKHMRDAAQTLTASMDWTVSHARRELDTVAADAHRLAQATVQARLSELRGGRQSVAVRAYRRGRQWAQAAELALRPDAPMGPLLDVLCATKGGEQAVRGLLLDVSERRARVMGVAAESARRAERAALAARSEVLRGLRSERLRLRKDLALKAHPAAVKVWSSAEAVKKELVATGAKEPAWVKENLPSAPRPKGPKP